MHHPVLLKSAIDGLAVKPNSLYIDGTFGEGGHSLEILKKGGRVLGIDWDDSQIKEQRSNFKSQISNVKQQSAFAAWQTRPCEIWYLKLKFNLTVPTVPQALSQVVATWPARNR